MRSDADGAEQTHVKRLQRMQTFPTSDILTYPWHLTSEALIKRGIFVMSSKASFTDGKPSRNHDEIARFVLIWHSMLHTACCMLHVILEQKSSSLFSRGRDSHWMLCGLKRHVVDGLVAPFKKHKRKDCPESNKQLFLASEARVVMLKKLRKFNANHWLRVASLAWPGCPHGACAINRWRSGDAGIDGFHVLEKSCYNQ